MSFQNEIDNCDTDLNLCQVKLAAEDFISYLDSNMAKEDSIFWVEDFTEFGCASV